MIRTISRRASCCILLVAIAGVVGLAPTTEASTQRCASVLKGRNILSTRGPSSALVTLPPEARLSAAWPKNPDFVVTSSGDTFAGFVLTRVDADSPLTVVAGQLPKGGAFGAKSQEILLVPGKVPSGDVTLPAGNYELQTIGQGGIKAQINLRGLKGTAMLCPGRPLDMVVSSVPSAIDAPGTFWGGLEQRFERPSHIFFALAFKGDAWAAGQYGACVHRDHLDTPEPLRHSPLCPVADQAAVVYGADAVLRLQHRTIFFGAIDGMSAGAWDFSMWMTSASRTNEVDTVAAWAPKLY